MTYFVACVPMTGSSSIIVLCRAVSGNRTTGAPHRLRIKQQHYLAIPRSIQSDEEYRNYRPVSKTEISTTASNGVPFRDSN